MIIGDIKIKEQDFVEVISEFGLVFVFGCFDGIMGFGFDRILVNGIVFFFYKMIEQKFIDEFVFVFKFVDIEGEFEVIFGGVDKDVYKGKFIMIFFRCKVYWEVDFDVIFYGDDIVDFENIGIIFDIGIFFIVLFSQFVEMLNVQIGVKKGYIGQYIVDCVKCDLMKDVMFNFVGYNFIFGFYDYVFEVGSSCILFFFFMDMFELVGFFVILGDFFLCRYYFIYDFGVNIVSFVEVKQYKLWKLFFIDDLVRRKKNKGGRL